MSVQFLAVSDAAPDEVPDEVRGRVPGCAASARLDDWLGGDVTAERAEDLFGAEAGRAAP